MTEDTLNRVGVLTRREIEARLVAPLFAAFAEELGRERALAILRGVIVDIARKQGAALAQQMGGCTLAHFAAALQAWKQGNAMDMEVSEQTQEVFSFDVTRCAYAEMYRELGLADLGEALSCNRDQALIEGFNPQITLTRTQTLLQGASHCDFRYRLYAAVSGR